MWTRIEAEKEKEQNPIRGFMPFTEGASVEGTLHAACIKPDGRGFFLLRATRPSTVNVRDVESKTGQALCAEGDIIGIRKTGATAVLYDIPLGTRLAVTISLKEQTKIDKMSGSKKL